MSSKKLYAIYKSVLSQISDVGKELLVKGRSEKILLSLLLLFYMSYSLYYGFETSLLSHARKWYDLYFSFDNVITFVRGYSNVYRHPFLQVFSYPLIFVSGFITKYISVGISIFFSVFICSLLVSMSVLYVYRYLSQIVELSQSKVILITLFYMFFSTNIILAFTSDSFTASLFLLSFSVYYFSKKIKEGVPVGFISYFLMIFVLGGVTISNAAKGVIPMLFQKGRNIDKLKIIILTAVIFLFCMFLTGYESSLSEGGILVHLEDRSTHGYWSKVFSFFFGMPILFSQLYMENLLEKAGLFDPMISYDIYRHWWQYLFIVLLLIIVIASFVWNYKKQLVQYLALLLLFDVVLHVVLSVGLHEAMIYGGNWVYTIPLFIGWLYKEINEKWQKALTVVLSCMLIVLIVNNINAMIDFTNLVLEYYPETDSYFYLSKLSK